MWACQPPPSVKSHLTVPACLNVSAFESSILCGVFESLHIYVQLIMDCDHSGDPFTFVLGPLSGQVVNCPIVLTLNHYRFHLLSSFSSSSFLFFFDFCFFLLPFFFTPPQLWFCFFLLPARSRFTCLSSCLVLLNLALIPKTQTRNLPRWTGVTQSNRPLWSFCFLLSSHRSSFLPSFILFHFHGPRSPGSFPLTTLHCLLSFASLCHTDDLLLCPRPFVVRLSSTCLLIPSLFPCLCLRRVAWCRLSSLCCYLSEVTAGLRAYLGATVSPSWGCSEAFNPSVL